MWWTCWLLLQRTYPWPHRDGASPGIVEGGPHRGATVVVVGAVRAIVLTFFLPLALTLAFAPLLGVGAGGGGATGGHSGSC
jgi:hypothetical protein